eukprot:155816-Pyramimonas_sp.AAC.1
MGLGGRPKAKDKMWTLELWVWGGGVRFAVVVVIILHRLTAMGVDICCPGTVVRGERGGRVEVGVYARHLPAVQERTQSS